MAFFEPMILKRPDLHDRLAAVSAQAQANARAADAATQRAEVAEKALAAKTESKK